MKISQSFVLKNSCFNISVKTVNGKFGCSFVKSKDSREFQSKTTNDPDNPSQNHQHKNKLFDLNFFVTEPTKKNSFTKKKNSVEKPETSNLKILKFIDSSIIKLEDKFIKNENFYKTHVSLQSKYYKDDYFYYDFASNAKIQLMDDLVHISVENDKSNELFSRVIKKYFDNNVLELRERNRDGNEIVLYTKKNRKFKFENELQGRFDLKRVYRMVIKKKVSLAIEDNFEYYQNNHFLIKMKHPNILKTFEVVETNFYFYQITQRPYFDFQRIIDISKEFDDERLALIKCIYTAQFLLVIFHLHQCGFATFAEDISSFNLSCNHRGYLIFTDFPKINNFDFDDLQPLVDDFGLFEFFFLLFNSDDSDKEIKSRVREIIDTLNVKEWNDLQTIYYELMKHDFYKPINIVDLFNQEHILEDCFSESFIFENLFDEIIVKVETNERFLNSEPYTSLTKSQVVKIYQIVKPVFKRDDF